MSKVEAIQYGDRKVYAVAAFNRGVAEWLQRLPTVWVEGEVTELRRNPRWQSVFFTLKDPNDGACLGVTIARSRFDEMLLADVACSIGPSPEEVDVRFDPSTEGVPENFGSCPVFFPDDHDIFA